jgi:predicted SAM-dependent methyltransferase
MISADFPRSKELAMPQIPAADGPPKKINTNDPYGPKPKWKKTWRYKTLKWCYQPVKWVRSLPAMIRERLRQPKVIQRYLSGQGFKGLQVGCGPHKLPGWINSDLPGNPIADIAIDITDGLPFPDACLDVIYAEEVIEHIDRFEGIEFVKEAYRVLRPGGVLKLTTPDLTNVCRIFLGQHEKAKVEQFATTWISGDFSNEIWLNQIFLYYGHQHVYSANSLTNILKQAGFSTVTPCAPQATTSKFPQLAGIRMHNKADAPAWVYAGTLMVEATK